MTAVGTIVVLFYLVDKKPSIFAYKPLRVLGESSLFIYIFHLALIEYVISPNYSAKNFIEFLSVYVSVAGFIAVLAYGLRVLKVKWKHRPFVIRFLLGG